MLDSGGADHTGIMLVQEWLGDHGLHDDLITKNKSIRNFTFM
jgi:hypothetical protein